MQAQYETAASKANKRAIWKPNLDCVGSSMGAP